MKIEKAKRQEIPRLIGELALAGADQGDPDKHVAQLTAHTVRP
jgi:hypothetical protein